MADTIEIKDLLLRTIIGINPEEREKKQDVLINISLHADLSLAGRSDNIQDSPNYRTICKNVIERVESTQFYLVERLAEEIASICLSESGIQKVRVSLEKPGALRFARSVGVIIERSR